MILTQPPSSNHTTGNVTIRYWDGSEMVTVSNQSPAGMESESDNLSTTFTFDATYSQYYKLIVFQVLVIVQAMQFTIVIYIGHCA